MRVVRRVFCCCWLHQPACWRWSGLRVLCCALACMLTHAPCCGHTPTPLWAQSNGEDAVVSKYSGLQLQLRQAGQERKLRFRQQVMAHAQHCTRVWGRGCLRAQCVSMGSWWCSNNSLRDTGARDSHSAQVPQVPILWQRCMRVSFAFLV